MPLRDHFRPPVSLLTTCDALHGMWPAEIVRQLRTRLPRGYVAAPTVHPGSQIEIDVAALQQLPEDQREVIVARLWGGLSFEQIAEVAGCSASTSRSCNWEAD